jgi:uncharacterized Fe-S radical SAM superfamily protein PflX
MADTPRNVRDPSEVRPPILILKEEKSRKETSIIQTRQKLAKFLAPSELKAGGEERRSVDESRDLSTIRQKQQQQQESTSYLKNFFLKLLKKKKASQMRIIEKCAIFVRSTCIGRLHARTFFIHTRVS